VNVLTRVVNRVQKYTNSKKVFTQANLSKLANVSKNPIFTHHGGNKMMHEVWKRAPGFPAYSVSSAGRLRYNKTGRIMSTSRTTWGHVKISINDEEGRRRTVSVAPLVAHAFLEPLDELSNSVILLDGDLQNLDVRNLALRPRWFAWKYARQLRTDNSNFHFHRIPIYNVTLDRYYPSIFDCGKEHGLLFSDILRSANVGTPVYPYGWRFEHPENTRV